jgi:hypothetical protein
LFTLWLNLLTKVEAQVASILPVVNMKLLLWVRVINIMSDIVFVSILCFKPSRRVERQSTRTVRFRRWSNICLPACETNFCCSPSHNHRNTAYIHHRYSSSRDYRITTSSFSPGRGAPRSTEVTISLLISALIVGWGLARMTSRRASFWSGVKSDAYLSVSS